MPYFFYEQGSQESMMLYEHFTSMTYDISMPINGNNFIELVKIAKQANAASNSFVILHNSRIDTHQRLDAYSFPTRGEWLYLPNGEYPDLSIYNFNDKTRAIFGKHGAYITCYSSPMYEEYIGAIYLNPPLSLALASVGRKVKINNKADSVISSIKIT